MINKKAQSQIITTVLIILLVLAAIVIVWQVVKGTVDTGAEQITTSAACLGINMDIASYSYNSSGEDDQLNFKVTRKTGAETADISGLTFLIDGAVTAPKDDDDGVGGSLDILTTTSTITFNETNNGDFNGQKLEVAAVLSTGQTCDVAVEKIISHSM